MSNGEFKQYRHKTIRAFKVGRFQFKNFILRIPAGEAEEFEALVNQPNFPARDRNNIVAQNVQAIADSETPISARVVGAQQSTDVTSPKTNPATQPPESVTGMAGFMNKK